MRCDVHVFVFGVMGEVTGKQDEIGPFRQGIDHVDRPFEGFGSKRIGRPVEADVCVAELDKREWGDFFAAGVAKSEVNMPPASPWLRRREG